MTKKDQAIRHWKRIISSREPRREVQRGILGDGNGNVRLTSRPDYVYCRVKSEANAVWQVLNHKVADVEDLPVLIEKVQTGNDWQVIDVDVPMLANVDDGWEGESYLPNHAASHEWPDGDPGMDAVDIHPRALTPLRCYPKNTTELKVRFAPLRYTYGGEFKAFPGGELDLSSYQPASGQARYVLTYLDPRDNLPYAVFGGVEADATPLTPPTPDIPPYAVLSSLVRVDGDQTYFPESDFVDQRDLLNVLTPDKIDDLADVEIHDLADSQVLTYDNASGQWINANQSGGGVTDAQYLVLALDGTLTAERRFVDGTGLTGTDGGAGGDYTVDLDIDSLAAEATADDADTIAIHDDSAGAIKKQTRANFLPSGVDPSQHTHSKLVASDGAPDPAWSVDASGNLISADGDLHLLVARKLYLDDDDDTYLDANIDDNIRLVTGGSARVITNNLGLAVDVDIKLSQTKRLYLDGNLDTSIRASVGNQIDFEVGGADRMTLTNSGLALQTGARVNEIRTSVAAADNTHLVTEAAVKAYVDKTWTNWTPTVDQGGAVAVTVVRSRYKIVNKICHVEASLQVTGAGVAANPIVVGGQPAAIQAAYSHANGFPIGTSVVTDTGTSNYSGILCSVAATTWRVHHCAFNDWIGSGPSFALENGDVILFTATYEVA